MKKESNIKLFLLLILPILVVLSIIVIINYDNKQSNGRNVNENQLRIETRKINIRSSNTDNSPTIGTVYKGEIYTILDNEEEWYKIKTNSNIEGWIYGGSNYIYLYQTLEPPKEIETKENNYVIDNLKEYLEDNYTKVNNLYQKEENNKKYIFNLDKNEYIVRDTNEIVYNYSLREMTYTERNNNYYIVVKWNTETNNITFESRYLGEEYANNIVNTILKEEYNKFKTILQELNIEENELKKEE